MTAGFRFAPGGRERLLLLDYLLDAEYGAPEAVLGNQPNPLDEAVYIILSFQTDLRRFRATWASLRAAFPRWDEADRAPVKDVADVLCAGGLHRQKATAIKRLLRAVYDEFGRLSLAALREMDDAAAERVLTRLPGLSWKGARCVLLYSLQRDVLPVDGNTFRILRRAGVIPGSSVYRRRSLHDALQTAVPAHRRRNFHVNLVVHGQRACLPGTPRCESCPALSACQRRGLGPLDIPLKGVESQLKRAARRLTSTGKEPNSRYQARAVSNGCSLSPERGIRRVGSAG